MKDKNGDIIKVGNKLRSAKFPHNGVKNVCIKIENNKVYLFPAHLVSVNRKGVIEKIDNSTTDIPIILNQDTLDNSQIELSK